MGTSIVHSVRLGFATNSSSTHSLLLLRPGEKMVNKGVNRNEFGWDLFVASTRRSREIYVALIIMDALRNIVNEETARLIVKSLTGLEVAKGYIDHQSIYSLPMARDCQGLNLEFLREFQSFMTQKGLVIVGGNDNEESLSSFPSQGEILRLGMPKDSSSSPYFARKDSRGYWTMFNVATGAKVRFSWDGRAVKADKSDVPELVDLKITSFCLHGCPWCYQASEAGGRHADYTDLDLILRSLAEMGVFEIAIGGGEPTCHPKFWNLLRHIRTTLHMVPNFSTRSLDWLYVPEKAETVRKMCGGFAVSVSNDSTAIDHVVKVCMENRMPLEKLSIQYAIGTGFFQAEGVMRKCREHGLRCTLLGYKKVGRGQDWKPQPDDWIGALKNLQNDSEGLPKIGIDTVLAESSREALGEMNIAKESYEINEGKFSMYVDAVECTMGPSSYGDIRIPLPDRKKSHSYQEAVSWLSLPKAMKTAFASW
jgi:hypothetical protein